jgi:hypothetical protein
MQKKTFLRLMYAWVIIIIMSEQQQQQNDKSM